MPTCFIITSGVEDIQFFKFSERFYEIQTKTFRKERMPIKHCEENWWIVKPANLNQGRGIEIFNSKSSIMKFISYQLPHSLWVVQKYLERPLLYKNRKFDIRLWVLVKDDYEIFLYKKSYVRTSSADYLLNEDKSTHLTNNCFQVKCDTYGLHEEGNIISLEDLENYIKETKHKDYNLNTHFFPYAKSHVIDTIIAGKKYLEINKGSFELFGFDLMIDEDLRVWLIECNTNPHLGMCNQLMKERVPNMLNEMLTLTIDTRFPADKLDNYETGNFWRVFNASNIESREFELLTLGPYPIKEFECKTKLLSSKAKVRDGRRMMSSFNEEKPQTKKNPFSNSQEFLSRTFIEKNPRDEDNDKKELNRSLNVFSNLKKVDPKKKPAKDKESAKTYNIENIKTLLSRILQKDYCDENEISKLVDRAFSSLKNFVLYSDLELKQAVNAIKSVVDSQFIYLVGKCENYLGMLSFLSDDQAGDVKISKILYIFEKLVYSATSKFPIYEHIQKTIEILGELLLVLINSSNPRDLKSLGSCVRILCNLCGDYDRRIYVPGETTNNEKVRVSFLLRGGLIIILAITLGLEETDKEDISQIPKQTCLKFMKYEDWIISKAIIEAIGPNGTDQVDLNEISQQIAKKLPDRLRSCFERVVTDITVLEEDPAKIIQTTPTQTSNKETIEEEDENIQDENIQDDGLISNLEGKSQSLIFSKIYSILQYDSILLYVQNQIDFLQAERRKLKEKEKEKLQKILEKEQEDKEKKKNEYLERRIIAERKLRMVNQKLRSYEKNKSKQRLEKQKHLMEIRDERKKQLLEKLKQREQTLFKRRTPKPTSIPLPLTGMPSSFASFVLPSPKVHPVSPASSVSRKESCALRSTLPLKRSLSGKVLLPKVKSSNKCLVSKVPSKDSSGRGGIFLVQKKNQGKAKKRAREREKEEIKKKIGKQPSHRLEGRIAENRIFDVYNG